MRVIITLIVTFFVLMREFKAFDGRYWMLGGSYSSIFNGLLMMQWPSIKMDDLNGFYGLINCPPFPSLILFYASQALGIFLTCLDLNFFIFNYFLLQEW